MKRNILDIAIVVTGVAFAAACVACAPAGGQDDVLQQTKQFIAYNRSITLTPQQAVVMKEALSAMPAPCCSNYTAASCCCKCNMARTIWGLSKHMIAHQNQGVEEVRQGVSDWIKSINPGGFSGRACFNGGCNRPFNKDGCGGMKASNIIY